MKSFRTILPRYQAPFSLSHADSLLLIGSCFTEHIGSRLSELKFETMLNPNGIVYNPVSIARILQSLLWGKYTPTSAANNDLMLIEQDGLWHSWEHHGAFSDPSREAVLQKIDQIRQQASAFLQKTNRLLLTLGTAQVFTLRKTGQVVANNHKVPAEHFNQGRLSVAETVEALAPALDALHVLSPGLEVILTVSPVRHLRNGLIENQRSKAVLLLACEALSEQFDFVHYFPAYELQLDDLRDYRFFAADMTHPTSVAVDYIWAYFAEAFFKPDTQKLVDRINKVVVAARHRPFHSGSPEYKAFVKQQLSQIQTLLQDYPLLDFSKERAWFEQF